MNHQRYRLLTPARHISWQSSRSLPGPRRNRGIYSIFPRDPAGPESGLGPHMDQNMTEMVAVTYMTLGSGVVSFISWLTTRWCAAR